MNQAELKKKRINIVLLSALSYFLSIAPMAIPACMNLSYYTRDSWKVSALVMFLAIVICLVALRDKFGGLLKNNGQLKLSVFLIVFVKVINYISGDIQNLLIFSAIGSILALIPQFYINRLKRIVDKQETAGINADALKEALTKNNDDLRGRV